MSLLPRRAATAAVLALSLGVTVSACSDSGDDDKPTANKSADADGDDAVSGEEVLAFAKTRLDETSGVRLSLSTDGSPDAEAFLSEATGVIVADPPAFEGTASGTFQGIPASDVDIISVDGTVYADILGGFTEFDLPECVPDPAILLDPDAGVGAVLSEATDVSEGESERGGEDNDEILTPYAATVPGAAVQNFLPCAPGETFEASFTITADGALRAAELTGEFFEGAGPLTYTISVDEYDITQEIAKP